LRNAILVIAHDLVWSACVEQRQRGAVPPNLYHVLNKTLDRLLLPLFSLKPLAKRFDHSLGERFAGMPSERAS